MSAIAREVAAAVLLAAGVGAVWIAVIGQWVLRGPFDRLHAVGLATVVGPIAVGAAVVVGGAGAQGVVKTLMTAALVVGTGSVLTHATARAARMRARGHLRAEPEELAP